MPIKRRRFGKQQGNITYYQTDKGLNKLTCTRCKSHCVPTPEGTYKCVSCGTILTRTELK